MAASPDKNEARSSSPSTHGAHATKQKSKGGVIVLSLLLIVLIAAGIGGAVYYFTQSAEMDQAAQEQKSTPQPATPEQSTDQTVSELPENPIDFVSLKADNPDIYAWIYVPGTDVNLPVLQSVTDDNYYLDHNADGEYAVEGAIYSQSMNKTDFSDPVTVLYGHNLVNGSMFSTLHYFEDSEFFAGHDTMYVYMLGHILTYKIVAAYQYDDRHILNSFDFSDSSVVRTYFDYVMDPTSMVVNVRDGVQLQSSDKILQLSTCTDTIYHTDTRYLVTGVLISDQQTK